MAGILEISPKLVQDALGGCQESLTVLAEQVQGRVYPYMRRVLLDEHRAQDLTQDTAMMVLGKLDQFTAGKPFWPWVFKIATNNLRLFYRREARQRSLTVCVVAEHCLPPLTDQEPWVAAARAEM